MTSRTRSLPVLFCFIAFCVLGMPRFVLAESADGIQSQIDANNAKIRLLEAEIAAFQGELDTLGNKKNTLESTINSLALSQKQLAARIKITENKIVSTNLRIRELTGSIGDKEEAIATDRLAIASTLRSMVQNERESLIVRLISSHTFGTAWKEADQEKQFNVALTRDIGNLQAARTELAADRDKTAKTRADLVAFQNDLTLQKRSVDASKATQQQLLVQTRNQEANYQKMIAQKKAAEKSLEQELVALQSQLDIIVNPGLLPKAGTGILSWPFSDTFMFNCAGRKNLFGNLFCITQYFGNTAFSTANPQIYNGHGHNAIDIAAPIGTPIYAALGGTVLDTGNTDLIRGCYSFGKWIMITHNNGLSTLYSHLSSIDVAKGQRVSTKQLIGLSGMTGYATGPHLHFGVYATEGVKIMTLKQFRGATIGCANAAMPVATLDAYLNPLSYL